MIGFIIVVVIPVLLGLALWLTIILPFSSAFEDARERREAAHRLYYDTYGED